MKASSLSKKPSKKPVPNSIALDRNKVGNVSFCRNSGTKTRVVARVRSIYKIEEIPKPIKNHLNAFLGSVTYFITYEEAP